MKFSKLVLPGISMIAVTYGLARFGFGLLLPDINQSLGMSELVTGLISSLFYLSYCFTIVPSTVLTTRKGPRQMIMLAGLAAFVGMLLMSVTPNAWLLAVGVLFAGGSTGLISPPYGATISLWINEKQQGKANTWINSGTSFGIVLSGIGAILLSPHWRLTYLIYAFLTLLVLIWNFKIIPKTNQHPKIRLEQGHLSIRGVKGAVPLIFASLILGIATAPFWTFSRSFVEMTGHYSDWQLSLFWIVIGLFGVLGGLSGSLIERFGLSISYKLAVLLTSAASIILSISSGHLVLSYLSAAIFGSFYVFFTGILLVWGIRVFITNASLGIAVPFLLLAVGQVIGSLLAGMFIGTWGYHLSFILFGIIGMVAMMIGPKKE